MHRGGALTRLSDPMPCRAEPTDRSSGAETAQPGGQHVLDPSVHAHGGGGIGPRRPVVDDHHRLLGPNRRPHEAQPGRSEEHTSELQSRGHLVCRLLLEKKNIKTPSSFMILSGFMVLMSSKCNPHTNVH